MVMRTSFVPFGSGAGFTAADRDYQNRHPQPETIDDFLKIAPDRFQENLFDVRGTLLPLGLMTVGDVVGYAARIGLHLNGFHGRGALLVAQIFADELATSGFTASMRFADKGWAAWGYEFAEGLTARSFIMGGMRLLSGLPLKGVGGFAVKGASLGVSLLVGSLVGERVAQAFGSNMPITSLSSGALALRGMDTFTSLGKLLLLKNGLRKVTGFDSDIVGRQMEAKYSPPEWVGTLPYRAPFSESYRSVVRRVLLEQKAGFIWNQHMPDGIGNRIALFKAMRTVEQRRLSVAQAAAEQMSVTRSKTFDKMDWVTEGEKIWLKDEVPKLAAIAHDLFTAQVSFHSADWKSWMQRHGDDISRWHYERIRDTGLPALMAHKIPDDIPDKKYQPYASAFPFKPDKPAYSAMWPHDLSKAELEYLTNKDNFDENHPVRRPYTVVERAPGAEASKVTTTGFGAFSSQVIEGLNGQRYRVTNMRFHPHFESYFTKFSDTLRTYLDSAHSRLLHKSFRDYLSSMAIFIDRGDFDALLKADINQTKGNLFFTFFPHEGYWPDQTKFPWMFEVGIRDPEASQRMHGYVSAFQKMEEEAVQVAKRLGAPVPDNQIDVDAVDKLVQVIWSYRTAGFMRGFPHGEPLGHDYPKVKYASVSHHRGVVISDPLSVRVPLWQNFARAIFDEDVSHKITFQEAQIFVAFHEAAHGVSGNKPDTVVKGDKTLGAAYGDKWEKLAEPSSDLSYVVASKHLMDAQKMTSAQQESITTFVVTRALERLIEPETFLDHPSGHATGATTYLAWLYDKGIVRLTEAGKVNVKWEAVPDAFHDLWTRYLEFGFQDKADEYIKWTHGLVQKFQSGFLTHVAEAKKQHEARVLTNRDDIPALPSA